MTRLVLRHAGARKGGQVAGYDMPCGHAWTLCPLPVPAAVVATAIAAAVCPACGGAEGIEVDAGPADDAGPGGAGAGGGGQRDLGEPRWGEVPRG